MARTSPRLMEAEPRGAVQPGPSQPPAYHPQIPAIQGQYDQPRYSPAGAQNTYQAIQPQPARAEYAQQPAYPYASPNAGSSSQYPRYDHQTYTASPQPPHIQYNPEPAVVPRSYALPPLDASSSQHQSWATHPPYAGSAYAGHGEQYASPEPRGKGPEKSKDPGPDYERKEGLPNYPPKAPSRGPKQRFTPEDDDLLRRLKEDYQSPRLSWKQIADFFPDRNSGTLQVRYCTKLKRKDEIKWSDDAVSLAQQSVGAKRPGAIADKKQDKKLQRLFREDQSAAWKRVAQKMGTGASEIHCQERYEYLEAEQMRQGGISDGDDIGSQRD